MTSHQESTQERSTEEPINAIMIEQVQEPMVTISQVPIYSSYASVVDPNEGTELRFVPTRIINEVKCAKLEKKKKMW